MKKKLICLLLCLTLLPVFAVQAVNDPYLPRVVDEAGILTDSEIASLTDTIDQITDKYPMDVVIVTVSSLGYKSAQDYADDYYDENGYGTGDDYSGVLLLISMDDRHWWISTCGDAIYAITDYGIQALFSEMKPYLSADRFYEAFDAYLSALPRYFEAFAEGDPIDSNTGFYDGSDSYSPGTVEDVVYYDEEGSLVGNFLISLVIGLVAALITILIMRSSMNTKRAQHSAGDYLKQGSFNLRVHRDMFLYSNVSKTPRPKETHSGGGSSVHRSSGGRSHGGGGGRF